MDSRQPTPKFHELREALALSGHPPGGCFQSRRTTSQPHGLIGYSTDRMNIPAGTWNRTFCTMSFSKPKTRLMKNLECLAMSTAKKIELSPDWSNVPSDLPERAVELAAELLRASRARETPADQARTAQMARMMNDPPGKAFTIIMTDQILKIAPPDRAAQRLADLACRLGIPRFLTAFDRTLLWAGIKLAQLSPSWVMPPD